MAGGSPPLAAVRVARAFIGAGCNRVVNNVSWSPSGLVAFGAHNAVAIFDPESAQILTTLRGHKAAVNCTLWLPTNKDIHKVQKSEKHFLLSGSVDGLVLVWGLGIKDLKWRLVLEVQEAHKKGITCLAGIMISENVAQFCSASSDGAVKVWVIHFPSNLDGTCQVSCLDTIFLGSRPMIALSLVHLLEAESPGQTILAMGGLDKNIHLYCSEKTGKFVHACDLKGHTDWVRSLDFSLPIYSGNQKDIFLVSSSQDRSIRIWKMASIISSANSNKGVDMKNNICLASYIEGPVLVAGPCSYQVSLESLLVGHEDWVYSVEWHPPHIFSEPGNEFFQPMSILSASMDKTMMIWRPERTTGIWLNMVTVGELSHSALGFYGGHWSPNGESILAHGYGGSFHLWRNNGSGCENWQPQKVPSGHFACVSDIVWDRSGEYILSVSHDQTARIFACWKGLVCQGSKASWHEIARPQVHGHDMNCLTIIQDTGNHRFVSGSDEKVSRVFEAPLSFLKSLSHAIHGSIWCDNVQNGVQILGANMSALGLSQKPIYAHAQKEPRIKPHVDVSDSLESIPAAMPIILIEPPIEEQLAWHTLWPESHKLYGHGNELFSLCSNHEGSLVASSCKAQSASVAEIWLWEVGSWKAVGRLQSHSLTVTQMEFSHDDSLLLAVSRDRQFSLFSLKKSGSIVTHELITKHEAHKRIIWACSWNPFRYQFATGSRDKTVKVWSIDKACSIKQLKALPQFSDSVTALSWVGLNQVLNTGILAVGLDCGRIELWNISGGTSQTDGSGPSQFDAVISICFDHFLCHVSTVHRLTWRNNDGSDSNPMQLASCGADHCVRVFDIFMG